MQPSAESANMYFDQQQPTLNDNYYSSALEQQQQQQIPSQIFNQPSSSIEDYVKEEEEVEEVEVSATPSYEAEDDEGSNDEDNEEEEEEETLAVNNSWTAVEDRKLLSLHESMHGDWKRIAKKFGSLKVTPSFLRKRFYQINSENLPKRAKFTHREDLLIAKFFNKIGTNWERMSKLFQNRGPMMLKNRYYAFVRKGDAFKRLLQEVEAKETQFAKPIEAMTEEEITSEVDLIETVDEVVPQEEQPVVVVPTKKSSSAKKSKKVNTTEEAKPSNGSSMQSELLKQEIQEARADFEAVYHEL